MAVLVYTARWLSSFSADIITTLMHRQAIVSVYSNIAQLMIARNSKRTGSKMSLIAIALVMIPTIKPPAAIVHGLSYSR
eukprot:8483-Heterococcus_DN1.PRE.1